MAGKKKPPVAPPPPAAPRWYDASPYAKGERGTTPPSKFELAIYLDEARQGPFDARLNVALWRELDGLWRVMCRDVGLYERLDATDAASAKDEALRRLLDQIDCVVSCRVATVITQLKGAA